jgi:N-acetylneuraminic acid mutarotase
LNETWAYDYNTNTWTRLTDGPKGHLGARLAYDAESDRIILFGGFNPLGRVYDDTWAYDFNSDTWTEMKPSTSPPGRNYQAMAYDDKADRVLMYGGSDFDGPHLSLWAYDFNTNTWQERFPSEPHPSGREYPVMVYDASRTDAHLRRDFSGIAGSEIWSYDYNTNTWTMFEPSNGPGYRSRHAMVYSPATDRLILFGGQVEHTLFKYSNETWTYDLNTNIWTNMTSQP